MITIVKDGNKIICSQNSYDTMYKRLGYEILTENPKEKLKEKAKKIVEKAKEKELIKPIEEVFKDEVSKEKTKKIKDTKSIKNKSKKGE